MKIIQKKLITDNIEKHMYDINVPHEHAYILHNGVVTHNSSVVANSTNGLEPIRNRITVKSSKQGRVIQLAPGNKNWKYQTAFSDVNINTGIININAVVQKYTDMAMSTNLYYNPTHYPDNKLPDSVVHKDHLYAYKMGLKTLYYSNTDDGHVSSTSESNDCAGGGCKL